MADARDHQRDLLRDAGRLPLAVTAKVRNAVAIADGERGGEVRYLGELASSEESMRRLVKRIAAEHDRVHFCYEASPTGYGLYRLITALGHPCVVVAPSLIPRKPGNRVKTNRRDAVALAKLLRAGELMPVCVPDEGHEAIRDLVRHSAACRIHSYLCIAVGRRTPPYLESRDPTGVSEICSLSISHQRDTWACSGTERRVTGGVWP